MHEAAARALFEDQVRKFSSRLAARGWAFTSLAFPIIDCTFHGASATPLRIRLLCDDWNDQPPSIELLREDGSYLDKLPRNHSAVFNDSKHPRTGRPFVCMRGSREYHTHPSHLNDHWDNLRGQTKYTLGELLTQLWRAWQRGWSE